MFKYNSKNCPGGKGFESLKFNIEFTITDIVGNGALFFIFRSTESDHSQYLLSTEKEQEIPEDLICGICRNIFVDAVMIPCCGSSFCDDCKYKRNVIIE